MTKKYKNKLALVIDSENLVFTKNNFQDLDRCREFRAENCFKKNTKIQRLNLICGELTGLNVLMGYVTLQCQPLIKVYSTQTKKMKSNKIDYITYFVNYSINDKEKLFSVHNMWTLSKV